MNHQSAFAKKRLVRLPWLWLTFTSLGLGLAGAALPILPTTPFILLAAWAAPKGSPEVDRWLREHRLFGALITDWRDQQAISVSAKASALVMMLASWTLLYFRGYPIVLLLALGTLFISVGAYLLSRPTPCRQEATE